jgi:hypothetical protein
MRTYTFELDNKTYTLRYGYNAICDLEDLSNKPIQNIFTEKAFGFSQARLLIYVGLKWKIQGITRQQAGFICEKLAEENRFETVITKAGELLVASVSKGNETEVVGE